MNSRASCAQCAADVVRCVAIVADISAGARVESLLADPEPLLPEDGLLLHIGESYEDGRWVVAPLGTRSGTVLARQMALPHAHRPHACAIVPADWVLEHDDLAVPA